MIDLNALSLPDLFAALTDSGALDRLLDAAFEEDLGLAGDITSRSIIPAEQMGRGEIIAREAGVLAGLAALPAIIKRIEAQGFPSTGAQPIELLADDGDRIQPGQAAARLHLPLRQMLAIERIMLNLLGRLSGVATLTARYVDAVAGTKAAICDTRKTTPGLRALEKYAVRCGGATLHRIGLHDAALYKDNHLAHIAPERLIEELTAAAKAVRNRHEVRFVEVEVDTLIQLERVLAVEHGLIDIILLDNMAAPQLREAVELRNAHAPNVLLEASGGVNLHSVRAIAESGVDRISVGAITHSAPSLDVGLDAS
jgi:nicotinate-nucleotide pyrophosphorylase (carboxylating)